MVDVFDEWRRVPKSRLCSQIIAHSVLKSLCISLYLL